MPDVNELRKKLKNSDSKQDNAVSFVPREYQIEIFEAAKKNNTIACLGTGTGKTYIAIMLIKEMAVPVRLPFENGGKRIFFLVPTVPLVHQQSKAIKIHTDLKVGGYCGSMNVDSWNKAKWEEEFTKNEILVMTGEIFRVILHHSFITIDRLQLLVFDECHRAQGNHPYREALKCFAGIQNGPRIFGLSASLLNGKCKPSKLNENLRNLELTMNSTIVTANDIADIQRYGTDPKECLIYFKKFVDVFDQLVSKVLSKINELKLKKGTESERIISEDSMDVDYLEVMKDIYYFDKPIRCLKSLINVLEGMGPWCAWKAGQIFLKDINTLVLRSATQNDEKFFSDIRDFLNYFCRECQVMCSDSFSLHNIPDKMKRLLEIFTAAKISEHFTPTIDVMEVDYENDPLGHYKYEQAKKRVAASDIYLSSLVFVEQRITSYVLCEWLKQVVLYYPEYRFLKPDFVIGHGCAGYSETSMMGKVQDSKLKAFRENNCNLLVATSVLEEGMDIGQCNLVIRFDLPNDFRSYIQSKGRARAKHSIYAMLIEENVEVKNFILEMCNYKTIEKWLTSNCTKRSVQDEEDVRLFNCDHVPPFMPYGLDGPRITIISSMSVINRYCSMLPSDMATKLVPRWIITEQDETGKMFLCTLYMPINSALREKIESEPMKTKKLAKMSAALKACEKLWEIGELNESLVPISSLVENALKDELGAIEPEDGEGAQPGTNRRRQIYEKRIPIFLKDARPIIGSLSYLHVLQMNLIEPLPSILNPRNRPIINPADSDQAIGLLSSKKLPPVNTFRVFTKSGKIEVSIKVIEAVILTENNINQIEEFHKFVVTDGLWLADGKIFDPKSARSSYYIVPVRTDINKKIGIDWIFMGKVKDHSYNRERYKTISTVSRTRFAESDFHDAVVLRSYKINEWKSHRPTFHHVSKILYDLTPLSVMEKNISFKQYYIKKYDIDIMYDEQPLIETVQHGSLHLWKPLYVNPKATFEVAEENLSKSKLQHKNYREYLVPELCILHPFPSSFFKMVVCLPTILFRLNALLLAEEIRQKISATTSIGGPVPWPKFFLESSDKSLREHLTSIGEIKEPIPDKHIVPVDIKKDHFSNKIVSFEETVDLSCNGPSPSLLLQALTAKGAGDEFNLERLEMIGDSFLKYVMSVKIYFKYPHFDEGKLSLLRIGLIQNLRLYQRAKKHSLGEYLITTRFSVEHTWLPPCYLSQDVIDRSTIIKKAKVEKKEFEKTQQTQSQHEYFNYQVISDKSIADSVEALIGCYLLSCGQKGTLRMMEWMGLKPLFQEKPSNEDFEKWPPRPLDPIVVEDTSNIKHRINILTDGFERFEKTIGYNFRNKAFLLQAFTHPSYSYNDVTDCYQRLEFLGDAVLDYLVTRQLYEDPTDHSPGQLTDLRSSLVNNSYFAHLAVSYGYNKFLKISSLGLIRTIDIYIKNLHESKSFAFFQEHRYYSNLEEIECFYLEEVEVPKALGDVFESVAGAIYLDSGMSLNAVWAVCYPMMKPAFDHLCKHVPISPVRELYELAKTQDVFEEVVKDGDKFYIRAKIHGKMYIGVGPNKKVAKLSAAKRALADIKKLRNSRDLETLEAA